MTAAEAFSVTGQIQQIAPPASVFPNTLESDEYAFAFQERQRVNLEHDLAVDRLGATGSAGNILAGTTVNSTFLHFDPFGTAGSIPDLVAIIGTMTFDSPILGLIWTGAACPAPCPSSPQYIDASDFLGAAGTLYPTGALGRGLETDPFYDSNGSRDFIFGLDTSSIMIDLAAFPRRSDQLRIITAALPEPGSIWLFIAGIAGVVMIRRNVAASLDSITKR